MPKKNNASHKNTANTTQINFVPGMPPSQPIDETIGDKTNIVIKNSMPLVKIYPGIPSFTKGITLFTRGDAFASYSSLLANHGFTLGSYHHKNCLTLAYIADSFPTDTFSNEYGENFISEMANVASTGAASIAQMTGNRTATEALKSITNAAKKQGGAIGTAGGMLAEGAGAIGDMIKATPIAGMAHIVDALAAGSRLDFPMIWKSSGFAPSYTMTIRLYNPNPGSVEATRKYIVGPIAALMLLGIPISADPSGATYSWPFIHKIWSPGIYNLDPAFISNITVIKGGDQQQISFNQRLSVVDVRIDFGSLFSTMLAASSYNKTRPTLKSYIEAMSNSAKGGIQRFSSVGYTKDEIEASQQKENQALSEDPSAMTKNNIINKTSKMPPTLLDRAANAMSGALNGAVSGVYSSMKNQALTAITTGKLPSKGQIMSSAKNAGVSGAKSKAPFIRDITENELLYPDTRVSAARRIISDELAKNIPPGFKIG